MKKTISGFATIVLGCLLLTSCQKESYTPETPSLTGYSQIKNAFETNPWIFKHEAIVYSPDHVDNGPSEPCKEDDLYSFQLNGNAEVAFGSYNCGFFPDTSGKYSSWELQSDGRILKMVYTRDMPGGYLAGDIIIWTVDYITSKKLVIKRLVNEPGKSYTVVDTYIRN